jgi:putative oxidoreductase
MNPVRSLARILLSSMFITGGLDSLLHPEPKVPVAEDVARAAAALPGVPEGDTELLVRANGAVQLLAGALLAIGRIPRLSALALAASLIPTTLAGHPFWEERDQAKRQQQQVQFFKNASMFGGLILAALDTEGRPGLAWRTGHAIEHAEAAVRRTRRDARLAAKAAAAGARAKLAA